MGKTHPAFIIKNIIHALGGPRAARVSPSGPKGALVLHIPAQKRWGRIIYPQNIPPPTHGVRRPVCHCSLVPLRHTKPIRPPGGSRRTTLFTGMAPWGAFRRLCPSTPANWQGFPTHPVKDAGPVPPAGAPYFLPSAFGAPSPLSAQPTASASHLPPSGAPHPKNKYF